MPTVRENSAPITLKRQIGISDKEFNKMSRAQKATLMHAGGVVASAVHEVTTHAWDTTFKKWTECAQHHGFDPSQPQPAHILIYLQEQLECAVLVNSVNLSKYLAAELTKLRHFSPEVRE